MKLAPEKDSAIDALLHEWGRWRRLELTLAGAPRKHATGSAWQRSIDKDQDWEEIAEQIDAEPDEAACTCVHQAYEALKASGSGYHAVIRDWYVDGVGWPPLPLLRHARYLMWKFGAQLQRTTPLE